VKERLAVHDVMIIKEENGEQIGGEKEGNSTPEEWRRNIIHCIRNPREVKDRMLRWQSLKYTILDDDLYRRTVDALLLKCLSEEHAKVAMGEVHEGMYGTHQAAHKIKRTLKRDGLYWPTMVEDCFRYCKGCEACQWYKNVQLALASMLHHVVKPWPFRGWGLDFIGEVHPSSSKGHHFVLMAMDYFTKWIEVVPLRNMTHKEVISFVLEHIVHRFGIPQTLTTNQGPTFMSHQFKEFADSLKIKVLDSSLTMPKPMAKPKLAIRA
jgi:hypothetical protein